MNADILFAKWPAISGLLASECNAPECPAVIEIGLGRGWVLRVVLQLRGSFKAFHNSLFAVPLVYLK
jgi:hypothetical protein